jgi:hypothetical protein
VCGNRCAARPIADLSDLAYFQNNDCSLVLGGLSLMYLPASLGPDELMALRTIRKVAGPLIIANNPHLTSLAFLSNLETAENVRITDNPNLIDALLPKLSLMTTTSFEVSQNPRLCPERSPQTASPNQIGCANIDFVFRVDCRASNASFCATGIAAALGKSSEQVLCSRLVLLLNRGRAVLDAFPSHECRFLKLLPYLVLTHLATAGQLCGDNPDRSCAPSEHPRRECTARNQGVICAAHRQWHGYTDVPTTGSVLQHHARRKLGARNLRVVAVNYLERAVSER